MQVLIPLARHNDLDQFLRHGLSLCHQDGIEAVGRLEVVVTCCDQRGVRLAVGVDQQPSDFQGDIGGGRGLPHTPRRAAASSACLQACFRGWCWPPTNSTAWNMQKYSALGCQHRWHHRRLFSRRRQSPDVIRIARFPCRGGIFCEMNVQSRANES